MRVLTINLCLDSERPEEYEAGERSFLKDQFSVSYSSCNDLLSNSRLIRSDSSPKPTTYFDLSGFGFYNDTQLPALLEAETCRRYFPTIHNSEVWRQLHSIFRSLRSGGNLKELRVNLCLALRHRPVSPRIDCSSEMNGFMRLFAPLQGLEKVEISLATNSFDLSTDGALVENLLRQDVERVLKLLRSVREGCNLDPDIVCDCLTCFPPLHGKDIDEDSLDVDLFEQDQIDVQGRIVEVEKEKLRLSKIPEDEENRSNGLPYWMDERDIEEAGARLTGFQIGQPEGYMTYWYRLRGFLIVQEHHNGCRP